MLFHARRRSHKKSKTSKINSDMVVHSDDILLFDLVGQLIGVCCVTVLAYTFIDSSGVIQATTTKPSPIDKSEKPLKKLERKNSKF